MGDQVRAKEMIMMDIYYLICTDFCDFFQFCDISTQFWGEDSRRMTLQTKPVLTTCCITQPRTALFATYLSEIYSDWPIPYSKHCPIIRGAIAGRAWAKCSVQWAFYQQFRFSSDDQQVMKESTVQNLLQARSGVATLQTESAGCLVVSHGVHASRRTPWMWKSLVAESQSHQFR